MSNRVKGAELFDPVEYTKRDMIEGIETRAIRSTSSENRAADEALV